MLRYSLIAFLFLLSASTLQAQFYPDRAAGDTANFPYWVQMMQDPGAKFSDTRRAFEKYWEGRENIRHNGWKVFKRWEYINQDCVQPDGKLPAPGAVMDEYRRYFANRDGAMSPGGNWTEIGPVSLPGNSTGQPNGMGRINAIGFHPADPNTYYIGSPSGGLWRTTDGGSSWTVLTTATPTLGVSAILLHPANPNQILIGTGDRDASDAPGMGVYKSSDGGSTWTASNTGMGSVTVGMMIMVPGNPSVILAATSGGIYKSTDGGSTWTKKSSNSANYKDIRFKPGDPSVVYATENGKFYRSANSGDSWTQITSGVITGTRLVIGVSVNQPSVVYLCVTNGPFAGLLKSTDSGLNFTTQSTTPNIMDYACDGSGTSSQAWYDLCIAVDPNNANTLYVGGVNIWKSVNGGVSWTINSHWVGSSWGTTCAPSVHADIHCLEWSPVNGNLFTGCDGGIYKTPNGGVNWNDLSSGLGIAQVYRIGQSAQKQTLCMNGYQDNGTAKNTGSVFTTVIGGDGMECLVDYTDTIYRYGALYNGDIRRSTGGNYSTIASNGTHGITESGAWITPYILHETIPSTMFAGYVNVWRSTNVKASSTSSVTWTKISAGESGTCNVLEQSPANVDILYVVRSASMKRTDNANAASPAWVSCTLPGGNAPTDLEAHPTDQNIVYATAGNKVYKSTDKGSTWTDISGTLPAVSVNCIVCDRNSGEGLYIGNRTGVFYRDATMTDWIPFSSGLPPVNIRELEIFYDAVNPANNRIKAATYGRGLWQSDLYFSFAVTPSNQNVAYTSGSTTFSIAAGSSTTWTASSNAAWCTVTSSGTGSGTLTCNYDLNPAVASRVATITVVPSGGIPAQTVTVTQGEGLPTLSVTPPSRNVSATPDTTDFTVTSNTGWNVGSSASWCTATPSGTGNGTIVATVLQNPAIVQRTDTITVSVPGLAPVSVTVIQDGAAPTLGVVPQNQNVTSPAGSTSFSVTSNTTWTAWGDAPWCTVTTSGSGNGTLTAGYTENTAVAARVANITVSVSGIPAVIVTVTQSGAVPVLSVIPPNRNVPPEAGSTDYTVTSNAVWTAVSDSAWCVVTPSGSGNGTLMADYGVNPYYIPRIATITVTVSGLSPQQVTLTQAQSTVGMDEKTGGIVIFPNPTTGSFRVVSPGNPMERMEITVAGMTGKAAGYENYRITGQGSFDMTAFPEGCYFIKVRTGTECLIRKLVIIR